MPANQRRRRLREIEPEKVDFVDRAANKRKFIVFKEDAMADTLGPELEAVSDEELRTATGGIDLDKAAAALSDLTAAVEVLKEQLDKDEPVTQEQLAMAEAAAQAADEVTQETEPEGETAPAPESEMTPAAVVAAIGEKAAMWAEALGEGPDPAKLEACVQELMGMLKPLMAVEEQAPVEDEEQEAAPPPPPPPPRGDQEEKRDAPEAQKAVETQKSESSFHAVVQEVAERALILSRKVAVVEDKNVGKEAERLLGLMDSLVEKYAGRKEPGFDLPDYNVVIDVDRKLNDIEDAVTKVEQAAKAEEEKAEEKVEEKAEEEKAVAVEQDKEEETKAEPEKAETEEENAADLSKALMARIQALTGQVGELQSFIAKARGTVPSPAADGEPEGARGSVAPGGLFPMDYNDPAYQVDLDTEETQ